MGSGSLRKEEGRNNRYGGRKHWRCLKYTTWTDQKSLCQRAEGKENSYYGSGYGLYTVLALVSKGWEKGRRKPEWGHSRLRRRQTWYSGTPPGEGHSQPHLSTSRGYSYWWEER